jgi:nicotinate-nucleotide pyrophosphorylase
VATLTRRFVDAVGPHRARILDTRKTTPGLRALEKAAVVAGGGTNHRFGLYDMVMVKDNHLAAEHRIESLRAAIRDFRAAHPGVRVELEADTLEQVRSFLDLEGVDVILLDNMTPQMLTEAVRLGAGEGPVRGQWRSESGDGARDRCDRCGFHLGWGAHPFRTRNRLLARTPRVNTVGCRAASHPPRSAGASAVE